MKESPMIAWARRAVSLGAVCMLCNGIFLKSAHAQKAAATLDGHVVDSSNAVVVGAVVTATNSGTGVSREATTDATGHFRFPLLSPGTYVLSFNLSGFQTTELRDVVLNINDQRTVRIQMQVAGFGETVHVDAGVTRVSTSPAVSTVVDRQFVENLPLSGRSLQSLLELTPGVTLFKANSNSMGGGQFSVNGQRTSANSFMVDGVSANVGINTALGGFAGQSAAGALPALTAVGSTQSLVSTDALQEFAVQTSTYAPEFGRTPGAQISMLTRSGTNDFHGTVSENFRHDALDANDWFANQLGQPKPKLRQHDFGGTFGGPLRRDHTFVFGSYEALRLKLPQVKSVTVPTVATRQQAPATVQPVLSAFPLPNGTDLGNGLARFNASYSDPSSFDTSSIRVDQVVSDRLTVFGRYSHAPSDRETRALSLSSISKTAFRNDSLTGSVAWIATHDMTNDLRANWSRATAAASYVNDDFGGASPLPDSAIFSPPLSSATAWSLVLLTGTSGTAVGTGHSNLQEQLNVVDTLTWFKQQHNIKLGVDYRRITPHLNRAGDDFNVYTFGPLANALAGKLSSAQLARGMQAEIIAEYTNLSAFAQDTWNLSPRLTLTYGVRWELNPAPTAIKGQQPLVLVDPRVDPVVFAAPDTRLWDTTYANFAPRVGGSYQISAASGRELMLRGGFGIFHDTGSGLSAVAFDGLYPYFASRVFPSPTFPLGSDITPPVPGTGAPQQLYMMDRHLELPYTYQWNVAIEQSLGSRQTVTATYVGSAGRRQLRVEGYRPLFADSGTRIPVTFSTNGSTSDYKALQVQFNRRLTNGLQAVLNYTLAKSQDTVSDDAGFNSTGVPASLTNLSSEYGPSDFDVRHALTAGVTWTLPTPRNSSVMASVFGHWGLDAMLRARSAFPLTPTTIVLFPQATLNVRPNVVPGVPQILTGSQYPGGRALNPDAFTAPAAGTTGDFPRNSVRGFPAKQVDLAIRREFGLGHGLRVQGRFELFNVFNHPNFADPATDLTGSSFGLSTQMLNRGLGSLSPLYQIGGPRSSQLSIKLLF